MKFIMFILIVSAIVVNCTSLSQTKPGKDIIAKPVLRFSDTLTNTLTITTDQKTIDSWKNFKDALLKNDLERLKNLSTSCISCENCDVEGPVPVNIFLKKYFRERFNSNLLSRMNDTAKVSGHWNDANWHIYSQACFFRSSDLKNPRIMEIFIKIRDHNSLYEGFEGADAAIAFIETSSGYKFCGFSTIP